MSSPTSLARRRVLAAGAGAGLVTMLAPFAPVAGAAEEPLGTRAIRQRRSAQLPVTGVGTAILFNFETYPLKYAEPRLVIQTLIAGGGRLIDEAHSYSHAEDRLAELATELNVRDQLFLATNFSCNAVCAPRRAFSASLREETGRAEVVQAWRSSEPSDDFDLLSVWEKQRFCRYVGLTTSSDRQDAALAKVLARRSADFLETNHSFGRGETEGILLPTARNAGAVVHVNLPLEPDSFSTLECVVLRAIQLARAVNRERGQESRGWSLVATSFV